MGRDRGGVRPRALGRRSRTSVGGGAPLGGPPGDPRDLDDALAEALRGPLVLLVFAQALFLALGTLSYIEPHHPRL